MCTSEINAKLRVKLYQPYVARCAPIGGYRGGVTSATARVTLVLRRVNFDTANKRRKLALNMPPKAPSTRTKRNAVKRSSTQNSSTPKKRANGRKRVVETAPSESEVTDDVTSDAYSEQDDEHDEKSLHSDALDDDSDLETKKRGGGKRKRVSHGKTPRANGSSPRKRHKNAANDEDEEGDVYELKEGQKVVGKVVQAPKTGRGQCYFYPPVYYDHSELIYRRSTSGSNISKYVQFSFAAHETRVQ